MKLKSGSSIVKDADSESLLSGKRTHAQDPQVRSAHGTTKTKIGCCHRSTMSNIRRMLSTHSPVIKAEAWVQAVCNTEFEFPLLIYVNIMRWVEEITAVLLTAAVEDQNVNRPGKS